jgi:hypothetical protein
LVISSEFITKHNKLLMDAVALYETTIERKWSRAILENPDLSVLPSLKQRIKTSETIEDASARLLQAAVTEYRKHLESLNKDSEPWVNMDRVKAQLRELDELDFRGDLAKNNQTSKKISNLGETERKQN